MRKNFINVSYKLVLIFLSLISITLNSQTPGGVNNVNIEYWLEADNINVENGADVKTWQDLSGNARNFSNTTSTTPSFPKFKSNAMNFHSAVDFYYDEGETAAVNATRKLVSNKLFSPETNKSYFTIWVTKLNTEYSDLYSTVFALNATTAAGTTGNLYGWRSTGALWHHTRGAQYINTNISKNYGVGIAIQPNNTTVAQQQYLNGLASTTVMAARTMSPTARESVFGTTSTGAGSSNKFSGEVMELIVLSKNGAGQILTPAEIKAINSHFAIKYGLTMAQTDYTLSDGTVIYNTLAPGYTTYNKNIFGLGRDDASGLYQKQSVSSDKSDLTVFVGDLAQTNKENASTFTNKTSLVFGSNGLEDYSQYAQNFGTAFQNYTLQNEERLNIIYNNKFRAKVTGQSSFTVNFKVPIGEWLLLSRDENFSPSNTRIYPIIGGEVRGIVINDGDYVGFTSFVESPGGITGTNIVYWLTADDVAKSNFVDGEDVTIWKDLTGKNFTNTEANPFYPRLVKSSMNFHSAVSFYYNPPVDGGPSVANNRRRKLMSENTFTPDPNKSYFTIWISKLDKTNSSNYATVFALNASTEAGGTGNLFGWRSTGNLWHSTGVDYTHSSNTKDYGIGIAVQPNRTGVPQQQYLNAISSSTTMGGRVMTTNTRQSTIGTTASNIGSNDYFFGEVMEVIVLSKEGAGQVLTSDELKKINTHLAIKYGITLADSQKDYLLSNNSVIYSSNLLGYSNYDKDIFGIARDDESGLNQKQSTSIENSALIAYLGELAETNEENTAILPNNNALVFGANGLTKTSAYFYPVGTAFSNYTLGTVTDPVTGVVTEEKLSIVFNYKLKAKATGASQFTINLNSNMGEWVLISQDESFTPSNTRIYKIVDGKVQGAIINDGDYLGFTSYIKAPAGVASGLVMWLNASKRNTITLGNAGEVLNWTDNSGYGTTYSKITSNSTAPNYVKIAENMNFHPAVEFKNRLQYLSTHKGPFSVAAPDDYTIFTTLNANFSSQARLYFSSYGSLTRDIYPALGVVRSSNNVTEGRARIYDGGGSGAVEGTIPLFKAGATTAMTHTMKKNNYFRLYADSYVEQINLNTAGRSSRMNGPGTLGYGGANDDRRLVGVMGEHIAYESELSIEDRDKIDGYLGLKYAITTDKNKESIENNFTFKFSDETLVWDGNDATHKIYHNNVASVLRDDDSDLNNKQSRSTDVGAIVHMGVGTKLGTTPELNNILINKTALTWGHNGTAVSEVSLIGNPDICGEMDSRLNGRIWLVDNTNFNQEILIGAYGSYFPYNGANYQVYLLVADSAEKLVANNWDQIVPMTFNDDKHLLNYKFTDKNTYFTFGAKLVGTCEGCAFDGVKRLEFDRKTWPTRGNVGPNKYNLGNDFNVTVAVEDPNSKLNNGYPRFYSRKTLIERRRGVEAVTTKVSFTNDSKEKVSAATSFEIYDIDRTGSRPDDVQVIGYCNGSPVYPKLSYMYNRPDRGRYNIQQSGVAKAKLRGERYSGDSGYTNTRGRVFVDFEFPVEEIHVVYKTNSTSPTLSTYIGIGPMEFYCPAPLPSPNEDGLIFTKQGTVEALLCETVDYTFRAINTNCGEKQVEFTDTLPEGMIWINDSFTTFGPEQPNMEVTGYGTRTLKVTGFNIPGGGSNYTFRASALFDETAVAGIYNNQAKLSYDRLGNPVELLSTDRLTGDALTKTTALDSDRPKPVATTISLDKSCFSLDGEIEVTLNFNNPNALTLAGMFLETEYDESAFALVPGSIKYSPRLNMTLQKDQEEPVEGYLEAEEFDLPSGEHWIKFKVKASKDIANYEIDPNTLEPVNLIFSYNLDSISDDCLGSALANASGELELPFCTYCTQLPTGGKATLSTTGISVMKDQFNGWPKNVSNGFLVLESGKSGMVVTRTTPEAIGEANWVKGMIIFDISADKKCISIYNGTEWKCIQRSCNQ